MNLKTKRRNNRFDILKDTQGPKFANVIEKPHWATKYLSRPGGQEAGSHSRTRPEPPGHAALVTGMVF